METDTVEAAAESVVRRLRERRLRLAVAESCTGGMLGEWITAVPGSSEIFEGGVVAYANRVKIRLLGVDPALLAREGAVSGAVAAAMARGVRDRLGADLGVGITGIAGPTGGTRDKPVGLVYVAVVSKNRRAIRKNLFAGDRQAVRKAAVMTALNLLTTTMTLERM